MNSSTTAHKANKTVGFSLIELLVVVAIIALLLSILVPSLAAARDIARTCVCGSNIRQLALANQCYSSANKGHFVLGAEDMLNGFGGTKRWHGVRDINRPDADPEKNCFKSAKGPLAKYLGSEGEIKECPIFQTYKDYFDDYVNDFGSQNAFEANCGGFGYNDKYIGGRHDLHTGSRAFKTSAKGNQVTRPAQTVMFTDTAMVKIALPGPTPYLIEYSFCEPPFFVDPAGMYSQYHSSASIHFRHKDKANVAWVDGHVDRQPISFTHGPNGYMVPEQFIRAQKIGWFGPEDNSLFDLK